MTKIAAQAPEEEAREKIALVDFASATQAGRRVAGVAAAARIVRELAEAGFAEARLVLPAGEALDAVAWRDAQRLAGAMRLEPASSGLESIIRPGAEILRVPGDRLVSAGQLLDGVDPRTAGIRLDRAAAFEILRRTGKASDGPVSRWLNRPVSRRISALLLHIPWLRPTHATFVTALLAVAMLAALVLGGELGLIAGALLYQAASIFDGVDGELARATYRTSRSGAALDTMVDAATNIGFLFGLTVNLVLSGHEQAVLVSSWGFILFLIGLSAIAWRSSRAEGALSLDLVKHDYRDRFEGRLVPLLIRLATIVTSRDFYALLFMTLVLVGMPMAVLYLFATAAMIWILFVAGSFGLGSIGMPASGRT